MGLRTHSSQQQMLTSKVQGSGHGTENPSFTAAGAKKVTLATHREGCSQALIAEAPSTKERAWD